MNSFLRIEESVITPYHLFTFNKINIVNFFALFYWNLGNDELFWDTCLNFEAIILIIIIIFYFFYFVDNLLECEVSMCAIMGGKVHLGY